MSKPGPTYQSTMDRARSLGMPPGERIALARFARTYDRQLKKVAKAITVGRANDVRHWTLAIFKSDAAKISAVVRTIKPAIGEPVPTMSVIAARARLLNPFQPIPEPVLAWPIAKPKGGVRYIVGFRWMRRACQTMCTDVLRLHYRPYSFDFQAPGAGGIDGAVTKLMELIDQGSDPLVAVVDLKSLFASVDKEKVAAHLPLPERVTRNVLLVQDGVKVLVKPPQGALGALQAPEALDSVKADEAVRQGIPQGSLASGMIVYQGALGPLLDAQSFAHKLVQFGDDLAVPVKDMAEAQAVLKTLEGIFASSPVGLLHIGHQATSSVLQGVDFVGYRVKRELNQQQGKLRAYPNQKSFKRFEQRAFDRYIAAGCLRPGCTASFRYLRRWLRSWPLWEHFLEAQWNLRADLRANWWFQAGPKIGPDSTA